MVGLQDTNPSYCILMVCSVNYILSEDTLLNVNFFIIKHTKKIACVVVLKHLIKKLFHVYNKLHQLSVTYQYTAAHKH